MSNFSFTEEQKLFRETIREFCEKNLTARSKEIDENRKIPDEIIKGMVNSRN